MAGAGTGKTTVVVEKIKHLIENKLAKPDEILALTFTEKAAAEMEERVDKALPYGYFQTWIATFHSFADQILQAEASHIGLNPDYKLLTQTETILFLRNHLFSLDLKYFRPLGNPQKFVEAILQHFSRLRDEDVGPEQYADWVAKTHTEMSSEELEKYQELDKAYTLFQQLKIKAGYFDFSDLIYYTLQLFRQRPHILEQYRKRFKYVLVDEFQDTNIAQYILVKLLCPPAKQPNLTVVGDDSQAIYKFRGASVSNILNFMSDYKTAQQITLNKNYRSNQAILDASYRLIKYNDPDTLESKLGISKQLVAQKKADAKAVTFTLTQKSIDEVNKVVETILELKMKDYKYSDFAILVRANSHAEGFVTGLARAGIPYRFLGPSVLFKEPEIKDLIAYLKILYNPEDSTSLYRVLSHESLEINEEDLSALVAFAKKIASPLYRAVNILLTLSQNQSTDATLEIYRRHLPELKVDTLNSLQTTMDMIREHLVLVKRESAGHIIYRFLEDTGRLKELTNYKTDEEEKVVINITKFFDKLKSFEEENEDASVYAVIEFIDMSLELGDSPDMSETDLSNYDGVNILTVHGSKGLEFPVVFLVNLSHGRFPTTAKKETIPIPAELIKEMLPEGDPHIQEERRLFYVALTRAQDKAYLSASLFYGEGKRERKISPFVIETLGKEAVENIKALKQEEKEQLSIFDFKRPETPIIKQPLNLSNFSFSQLESFNMCPLRYKYQYVLKIPTRANAAASFGESIHKSLQYFYSEFIHNNSLGLSRLLEIYQDSWIPLGYTSANHMAKMRQEGERMLKDFFVTHHTEYLQPISMEKLFKIKIDDGIFVTGKIDRVDKKNADEIEIIDYKTGKKPDEKELKKSMQLSIYAIAATDQSLWGKALDKVNLTFYYLQDMSKITMKRTAEEMLNVKDKIIESVEEIRKNEFQPKVGQHCNFCPFRMICEAW